MTFRATASLTVGDKPAGFPYPVVKAIRYDRVLVVMFESPLGVELNRNVYGLDEEGVVIWQIAESPHGGTRSKPYVDLFVDSQNRLLAANWIGIDYFVDFENGAVRAASFKK